MTKIITSYWSRIFPRASGNPFLSCCLRARRRLCHLMGDPRWVSRWANLLDSRRILPMLRQHFDPKVPPVINFELNTNCNYKCPFCPQSSKPRPVRHITTDAFRHIIVELKQLDYSNILVLNVNNEPFLHPLLVDFCRLISQELPNAAAQIITNGSLITIQHLKALSELERPPLIIVDDYTPDHRINARLRSWITDPTFSRLHIILNSRSWNETLSNRAGNQPGGHVPLQDCRDISCSWPFYGLFINSDLKAFLCCSDYSYDMVVGDLHEQGLMEIWMGEPLRNVRDAMLIPDRRRIPLCAKCDTTKVDWPKNIDDLGRGRHHKGRHGRL